MAQPTAQPEVRGTPARALVYGPLVGEQTRATMEGPLGPLGAKDVALSPNMLAPNGGPYQLGQVVNVHKGNELVGQYRVADYSYIKPGVPTFNTIELRDKNISGDNVTVSPADQVRSDMFSPDQALPQQPEAAPTPSHRRSRAAPGVDIGVTGLHRAISTSTPSKEQHAARSYDSVDGKHLPGCGGSRIAETMPQKTFTFDTPESRPITRKSDADADYADHGRARDAADMARQAQRAQSSSCRAR